MVGVYHSDGDSKQTDTEGAVWSCRCPSRRRVRPLFPWRRRLSRRKSRHIAQMRTFRICRGACGARGRWVARGAGLASPRSLAARTSTALRVAVSSDTRRKTGSRNRKPERPRAIRPWYLGRSAFPHETQTCGLETRRRHWRRGGRWCAMTRHSNLGGLSIMLHITVRGRTNTVAQGGNDGIVPFASSCTRNRARVK